MQVSKEDYVRLGSPRLGEILMQKVKGSEGNKPYFIPVGGSNAVGTWGYLECFQEIVQQAPKGEGGFTDIVMVTSTPAIPTLISLKRKVAESDRMQKPGANPLPPPPHHHLAQICWPLSSNLLRLSFSLWMRYT